MEPAGELEYVPFPLDVQFVSRAEAKLGLRLPPGYVVSMCRANGGDVQVDGETWWLYPIFDDSDQQRLKRTCDDNIRETNVARTRPGFPEGALAIGHNGGGDSLVLLPDRSGGHFGHEVFWWNHETDGLQRIADDFSDLVRPETINWRGNEDNPGRGLHG